VGWWPFADVVAALFLPALAAGLGCGVAWRFVPPGRLRTRLQIVAALLFFVPQLPVIFLLYRSIALLLYGEAVLAAWMLAVALLAGWKVSQRMMGAEGMPPGRRWTQWRETEEEIAFETRVQQAVSARQRTSNPVVLGIITLLMGGFGCYLGTQFVEDAFLPRLIVAGPVFRITPRYGSRAPRLFDIVIGSEALHVTHDVASRLRPGDQVRVEVGAGSDALLALRKLD